MITSGNPVQAGRIYRNPAAWPVGASCGAPKAWPGTRMGSYHYAAHVFTNTSVTEACVTVHLSSVDASTHDVQAVAYLDSFEPTDPSRNYLGDAGWTTAAGPTSFSCTVPAGAQFWVTVNEVVADTGCPGYTLYLSGLPCPPPSLRIDPTATPDQVRLHWPTWAGDYGLESCPSVSSSSWARVSTEPLVSAGRFNVTNVCADPCRFYQLKK